MRVNLSELHIGCRDLRMISGIVMLCYLASHLANHALGLVSLDAAEVALRGAVQFWGNPLVTVTLYGAAGVHVALAIVSVYERRTFRLPALELLRIALGLWLPVMLIGHAITTRLEYELVGAPSTYTRIVSDLWARDGEWQHMGLLAPGRLQHGAPASGISGTHRSRVHRAWGAEHHREPATQSRDAKLPEPGRSHSARLVGAGGKSRFSHRPSLELRRSGAMLDLPGESLGRRRGVPATRT
jgi:hypothetical protein